MELEVRIERLGAQGDGVAQGPDGPLFVPFTLPGELASVAAGPGEARAEPLAILEPSPERIAPVCPHFGTCGGCALQHMEARAYLAWKREQVIAALASRGLEAPVEEVRAVPLASRRRASFTLGRTARGIAFGYRAARSHDIVDIAACPVLSPSIAGRLPKLKSALRRCLAASAKHASRSRKPIRVSISWSRAYAPHLRCSPSWRRRVRASGLPASVLMAKASSLPSPRSHCRARR